MLEATRLRAVAASLPVRVAVTALALAILATQLDWSAAGDRLREGHGDWIAGAVAALVCGLLAGALRWGLLLRAADVPTARAAVLRGYFIGAFANNFLPTGFGGDAVRALAVARPGPALARAAGSVIIDRLSALACLVALGWLTLPFDPGAVSGEVIAGLAVVTAGALSGGAAVGSMARSPRARRLIPARARPVLAEMRRPLRAFLADRDLVLRVLALGIAYQALVVLSTWCGARAIGLHVSYVLMAVTVPLVLVLTLLPISLAGYGVREGGYAVLLGTAGVSVTDATLLSLITVLTMALASLPGALALLVRRRQRDA